MLFSYIAAKIRLIEAQAKLIELQIDVAVKNLAKQAEQEAAALKAVAEREARAAAIKASGAVKQVVADIKKEL